MVGYGRVSPHATPWLSVLVSLLGRGGCPFFASPGPPCRAGIPGGQACCFPTHSEVAAGITDAGNERVVCASLAQHLRLLRDGSTRAVWSVSPWATRQPTHAQPGEMMFWAT